MNYNNYPIEGDLRNIQSTFKVFKKASFIMIYEWKKWE